MRRLALAGDETILDAGCGSGGLTAELAAMVPRGRVIGVDTSARMLEVAREQLADLGDRVRLIHADLTELRLDERVDVVFSNAVFHHIPDHPALFRALHGCLRPGGRLVAQCGGGPNLARIRVLVRATVGDAPGRAALRNWDGPWTDADAPDTAARLHAAGFTDVHTWVEESTVTLPTPDRFREHLRTVTLRSHLMRLPASEGEPFLDEMVAASLAGPHPLQLDHWRLNMTAAAGPRDG